jgi:hypothetical protein
MLSRDISTTDFSKLNAVNDGGGPGLRQVGDGVPSSDWLDRWLRHAPGQLTNYFQKLCCALPVKHQMTEANGHSESTHVNFVI